jgi:CheY-like chemotaxis protein
LQLLAAESRRASEIVSRLVSFARQPDSEPGSVDVNAELASLIQFREPEWRAQGLRVQDRLAPGPAMVHGAQGQVEQVFLNLLVYAEQRASETASKTITIQTSVIAGRVLIEIGYSAPVLPAEDSTEPDPFSESRPPEMDALGMGVCQSIIRSHGGEIRFRARPGGGQFEVDLPPAGSAPRPDSGGPQGARMLTLLLVDPDAGAQRQLVAQLGARGHRVVPVAAEAAADLVQRLRFDAVLWAVRTAAGPWNEFHDKVRAAVPAFVLLSDGYNRELAQGMEESGIFLLARPVQDADLDRVLEGIGASSPRA